MTRNKKIIITLFVIALLLVGAWLSLDSRTKSSLYRATLCKLIYGKNICNFYEMMDAVSRNPESSDFEKAMQLCREMENVPKKDSCFEYIAQVVSFYDTEKAKQACSEIKEFKDVHSKEDCYTMVEKSNVWNKYINHTLGFSIQIPKEVYGLYKCPSKETIQVPVRVFEDNENGIVYISQEYYYRAEWDSELQEFTGPCEKIAYSLESLKSETVDNNPFLGWAILIKDIKDESELDKFIKEIYGSGCSAGQKTPWVQSGVYEIPVLADGTDLGNTACPVGWMNSEKVLYAPEKDKFMSVILGQECTFGTNPYSKPYQCYDEEMINGFKFE